MKSGNRLLAGLLIGIAGVLLAALLAALAIAYTGAYDIAASRGHAAGMRWLLDTTMHSSVRARASANDAQARLAAADPSAGAGEFKSMCEHCHGGPGVDPAEWSRGMLPQPPDLTHAVSKWRPAELYWIVEHGIKYTGMPAFGDSHDTATLWNIVAFVDRLPAMTPDEYRAYSPTPLGRESTDGHHHDSAPAEMTKSDSAPTSQHEQHDH